VVRLEKKCTAPTEDCWEIQCTLCVASETSWSALIPHLTAHLLERGSMTLNDGAQARGHPLKGFINYSGPVTFGTFCLPC